MSISRLHQVCRKSCYSCLYEQVQIAIQKPYITFLSVLRLCNLYCATTAALDHVQQNILHILKSLN